LVRLHGNHGMARRELRRRRLGDNAVRHARRAQRRRLDLFRDATLASAFVARWCAVTKVKTEAGCSGFVTTNRRRGSGRRCTGRFKSQRNPRRIAAAILPGASNMKCCCVRERRPARICERVNWWQSSSSRAPIGGHRDVSSGRRCVAGHPTASLTQLIAAAIAGVLSLCSPASNG